MIHAMFLTRVRRVASSQEDSSSVSGGKNRHTNIKVECEVQVGRYAFH